ncbi:SMEK domain-containing protein [Paenibacillus glucanolyticus]|uniref:SMEK domain-containing protein n=1 Tax=Paenibacillus glucanolyticus TaxID=59843 RepID=UPI00367C6012
MNRQTYYNEISEWLEILSNRIKTNGKLNVLDLNIHAETFYRDLLNCVYGYQFESANVSNANMAAIDLVDSANKLVIQVSSTATKQKIESTLAKDKISDYAAKNYKIKFVFIADEAQKLRSDKYSNPHKIYFAPQEDIVDKVKLLTSISQLSFDSFSNVHKWFTMEFGGVQNARGSSWSSTYHYSAKIISKINTINILTLKNLFLNIWLKDLDGYFLTGNSSTDTVLRLKSLFEIINQKELNKISGVNSENSIEALFNAVTVLAPDLSIDLNTFYHKTMLPTIACVNGFLEKNESYYMSIGALGLFNDNSEESIVDCIMNNSLHFFSNILSILDSLWKDRDYTKIENQVSNGMHSYLLKRIKRLIDDDKREYIKVIFDRKSIVDVELAEMFSSELIELRKKLYECTKDILSYDYYDNFSTQLNISSVYSKTFELYYSEIFGGQYES